MKLRLAQIDCVLGDVDANLAKVVDHIHNAAGYDAIVFPEMVDTGYHMDVIREQAGQADWSLIQAAAAKAGVSVLAGLSEREEDRIYNSLVMFDAGGEVVHRYRKTHLATVFDEADVITPGDAWETLSLADIPCGNAICFDLRFPELFRHFALQDAKVIFLISAWPFPRLEHWNTLVRARAIENQVYVVAVNRTGRDQNTTFCGSSRVIDPYGVVVTSAPEDAEAVLDVTLDMDLLERVRARLPVLESRRTDLP